MEAVKALRATERASSSALAAARRAIAGGRGAAAFRAAGGLPLLDLALRDPSRWPLAASALADCCLEPESRRELAALSPEPTLVSLLRSNTSDDCLRKACRLLANVSNEPACAERLHREGAVPHLVAVVSEKTTSQETLRAAVRALRLLWCVRERRDEALEHDCVEAVASALVKHCVQLQLIDSKGVKSIRDPSKDETVTALLKCIGAFTTHATEACAKQINTAEGLGYKCLVALTTDYETLALPCVTNLCHVPGARPVLGAAGAVERIVELLKTRDEPPAKCIPALHLLCRASMNRAKLKRHGGFVPLITAIENESDPTRQYRALQTLHCFIFDQFGLISLAKDGFIDLIARLMKLYTEKMKCEHSPLFLSSLKQEITKIDQDTKACTEPKENLDSIISDDESKDAFEDKNATNDEEFLSCEETPLKKFKPCEFESKNTKNPTIKPNRCKMSKAPSPMSPYSDSSRYDYSPDWYRDQKTSKRPYLGVKPDNYHYGERSPESTSSSVDGTAFIYASSSLLSPESMGTSRSPSSTTSLYNGSSDSDESEHYSPVCSEAENCDNDRHIENLDEESRLNESLNDDEIDAKLCQVELEANAAEEKMQMQKIKYFLVFLLQYSYLPKNEMQVFSSQDLLYSLHCYIEKCKYPSNSKAAKVLSKIVSNVSNFKYLLNYSIVSHLINIIHSPKHTRCKQCKQIKKVYSKLISQISTIAESEYGIQKLSQCLNKNDTGKENLILTLPHIIKSDRCVKKMFIDFNGLELFLNVSLTKSESLKLWVIGLTKLANSLKIRPPKPIFTNFTDCIYPEYEPSFAACDEIIFVLDDSSTVRANKQLLCNNSDVFVAMLNGMFKEGLEKRIRLQKVSKSGLEYLLILLESNVHKKSCNTFPLPKSLSTALETFLLADRFLIEQLKNLLFSSIVQFMLDFSTAAQVYIWSLEEGMGNLGMESVAYTLAGQISDDKKCKIVSSIVHSVYKNQWIDDIKYSLLRFMT